MKKIFNVALASLMLVAGIGLFTACGGDNYDYTVKAGESIQAVIDQAETGKSILVKAGTYNEQLVISGKNLTIVGEEGVVIAGPEDYADVAVEARAAEDKSHSLNMYGLVVVKESADVKLENIKVKGDPAKAAAVNDIVYNRYAGVLVIDSKVNLEKVTVEDIKLEDGTNGLLGMQTGYGVYVAGTQESEVKINNSAIKSFQKGGIYALTSNSKLTVTNSTIEGLGNTDKIAQNGIWSEGTATVTGCKFKNLNYTAQGADYGATGIALHSTLTADEVMNANTFSNVEYRVEILDSAE